MSQDIENLIPTTNIAKQCDYVRVVNKKRNADYIETNIELIRIARNHVNNVVQYQNNNTIHHALCLSIEDIKRSTYDQNCWKFHNVLYRNVLIYGRVVILNECSRDNRPFYTISIDDETECIDGYLNKIGSKTDDADKRINEFAKGKSTLERRKETGIKLQGQYYPSESTECKAVISNLKKLQLLIEKNLKSSERNFSLGPLKEKALVYGTPIMRQNDIVRLNIFDISVDDGLDLIWKQNINRLYSDVYFK